MFNILLSSFGDIYQGLLNAILLLKSVFVKKILNFSNFVLIGFISLNSDK